MASPPFVPLLPTAFALLLSFHGLRRKSLSPSGAATAFVVGLLMMTGGTTVFGVSLIAFYLTGSRATKYGKQRKARLEDGYHEAGYRSGWQVLSNSFAAFIACVLWNVLFSGSSFQSFLIDSIPGSRDNLHKLIGLKETDTLDYAKGNSWCPIDGTIAHGWSRAFIFAALGHFACCLGDTLASELGILSSSMPILITTLKPVPPGTNGGMSVGGTLASIAGGAIMGLVTTISLLIESSRCRESSLSVAFSLICWGAIGGGTGSLADSLLGATIQQTRYSQEQKKILQDESTLKGPVKVISGLNLLTNNQVNVVSSIFTSIWMSFL